MKNIVFFTGAGISAESEIKTFRGKNGLWENYSIKEICSVGCLDKNRDQTINFYDERRIELKDKRPNMAHNKIVELQKKYPQNIHIITQNIDDLFEKAGATDVLHLHGFLTEIKCEDTNCHFKRDIGYNKQGLDCPICGEYIRPNVVFFNEQAPAYAKMWGILKNADMVIIIGTSGEVINITQVIESAKYSILNNLEPSENINDDLFDKVFYGRATSIINKIALIVEKNI